jgi:hypothetical protein
MNHRSFILAPITLLAIAAIAAPAIAGTDSDDEDGAPVTTPAPAPFVAPPAAVPVETSAPPAAAPAPAAPAPAASAPVEIAQPHARRKAKRVRAAKPQHRAGHRSVVRAAHRARPTRTAKRAATMPRGGVQAGAGGMAR